MGRVDPFDTGDLFIDSGRRITALRKHHKLTQEQLAKLIGQSQNGVSYFETGQRLVSIEDAMKICELFQVTLDWIYFGDNATIVPHDLYAAIRIVEARLASRGKRNDPDDEPPDQPVVSLKTSAKKRAARGVTADKSVHKPANNPRKK